MTDATQDQDSTDQVDLDQNTTDQGTQDPTLETDGQSTTDPGPVQNPAATPPQRSAMQPIRVTSS
jgi:hypothetical protein